MWTSLARLYFTMETKQRRSYNRSETSSLQLETPKFEQNTDQYWSIRDKTNRDEDQRAHKNSKNHFDIPSRCLLSEQEYATTADQGRLKQTSYQMFDTQAHNIKLLICGMVMYKIYCLDETQPTSC